MYKITIYPNTLAIWFVQVYSGLFELERNGIVQLEISSKLREPELFDSKVLALDVQDGERGDLLRVLVDMTDYKKFSMLEVYDHYDIIVKRSYLADEIGKLPRIHQSKIIPYGINYECCSSSVPIYKIFFFHQVMRTILRNQPRSKWNKLDWHHQIRFLTHSIRNAKTLSDIDFEELPTSKSEPRIFFITRLFDYSRKEGLTDFMRGRIALVSALRSAFKDRFYGGIINDPVSRKYCPKEILISKVSHKKFVEAQKKSDISVCTLGSGQSTPWKLGEAIAASRCIVSEPLAFELPVPLEPGKHLQEFSTIEGCVAVCDQLLNNPSFIRQMKESIYLYYRQYVKADMLILHMLEKIISKWNENKFLASI